MHSKLIPLALLIALLASSTPAHSEDESGLQIFDQLLKGESPASDSPSPTPATPSPAPGAGDTAATPGTDGSAEAASDSGSTQGSAPATPATAVEPASADQAAPSQTPVKPAPVATGEPAATPSGVKEKEPLTGAAREQTTPETAVFPEDDSDEAAERAAAESSESPGGFGSKAMSKPVAGAFQHMIPADFQQMENSDVISSPTLSEDAPEVNVQAAKLNEAGAAMLKESNLNGAILKFKESLAIKPNAHVYFNLALASFKKKDLKTAQDSLRSALHEDPGKALYWSLLASVLHESGRYEDAKKAAKLAFKFTDSDKQNAQKKQVAQKPPHKNPASKPPAEQPPTADNTNNTPPDFPETRNFGNAWAGRDFRIPTAHSTPVTQATASNLPSYGIPSFESEWVNEIVVKESRETTTEAREFPGKGSQIDWAHACAIYDEGATLRRAGRNAEAIAKYEEAIKLYPYDADFHHNLGLAYKKLGKLENAREAYLAALRLSPNDWDTWCNLGSVLFDLKNYDDAKKAFNRALSYNPPENWQNNIGWYLDQMKNKG